MIDKTEKLKYNNKEEMREFKRYHYFKVVKTYSFLAKVLNFSLAEKMTKKY